MEYPIKHLTIGGIAVVATLTLLPKQSLAQEFSLEEIVVTAQKREQSIQDVGISITAFSQENLSNIGATGIADIARHTPGLNFENFTDLKLSGTVLRGINADTGSAGQDPSVGYYLDEVYLGPGVGANIDLFDVERVEVLRGPQGTLFGRNTIGGVVSITSKKPSETLEGYLEAGYGNYDQTRLKGSISGPLIDNLLAASFSAVYDDRDAYIDNKFRHADADGSHQKSARGALLFTPSENTEFLFSVDYRKVTQRSKSMETLRYNPDGIPAQLGVTPNVDPKDRNVFSNYLGEERLEAWGGMLKTTIHFDGVDLVGVTGYREHDYFNLGDTDMGPLDLIRDGDPERVRRFTQELRLVSDNDSDLSWIIGLYYSDQDTNNISIIELREDLLGIFGLPQTVLAGGSDAGMSAESYAVFASFSYQINDKFDVTLGIRQTYEKKSIDYRQIDFESELGFPLLGGSFTVKSEDDWNAVTPMLTMTYRIQEQIMAYGTISRGFKSGGFNDALGSGDGISFDPEYLMNYELGLKSSWFDQRVIANVALFYMDWEDIQLGTDNPDTPNIFDPFTSNAGKAHSKGIEIEAQALVSENLTVGANLSVMEAEYDEGEGVLAGGAELDKITQAPEYKLGLNIMYRHPIGDNYELTMRGDYIRQGESYLAVEYRDPYSKTDGYGLVNGRITLASKEGNWRLSLWGKNLTDEIYRVRHFDLFDNPLVGQSLSTLNAPRTYGAELRVDF